jgi:hypothetical protein
MRTIVMDLGFRAKTLRNGLNIIMHELRLISMFTIVENTIKPGLDYKTVPMVLRIFTIV